MRAFPYLIYLFLEYRKINLGIMEKARWSLKKITFGAAMD